MRVELRFGLFAKLETGVSTFTLSSIGHRLAVRPERCLTAHRIVFSADCVQALSDHHQALDQPRALLTSARARSICSGVTVCGRPGKRLVVTSAPISRSKDADS